MESYIYAQGVATILIPLILILIIIMVNPMELKAAAKKIIERLQGIEKFQNIRILIIGGAAIQQYNPKRSTQDLNILVYLGPGFDSRLKELPSGIPELLRKELKRCYPDDFAPLEMYPKLCMLPQHQAISFLPCAMAPYLPAEAMAVAEIKTTNKIPYISALDLLVFIIHCYGMRAARQRSKYSDDAEFLLGHLTRVQPIRLSLQQREIFVARFEDGDDVFLRESVTNEQWWRLRLGLE